ncbi:MCE family protein [Pseudonocardia spinosispora]|uniref:MCE family protein n=1 Tax=Pseudonocardia spinosispora TaxID=103441 RepID=UPI00040B9C34|nr:MCE family protein [Pseudonocardia spinosispora]
MAVAGVLAASLLSGCGISAADLPLPAGSVGGPSYQLTAVFADALNLPDGAHVKLNGDDIGRVQKIEARNYTARVTMSVRSDVPLPAGTSAELRQATPLGEVFVAVKPPLHPTPGALLRNGDTIGLAATAAGASVEDLLTSLGAFVNGGGLAQIQTIVHEANTALAGGRAQQTGHLLQQTNQLMATLNARTQDIDKALAATQNLTVLLNQRRPSVDAALTELTPAISVFADQTDNLVRVLNNTGDLSVTADHLLDRSGGDIRDIADNVDPLLHGVQNTRKTLVPTLTNFQKLGKVLVNSSKGESYTGYASVTILPLTQLLAIPLPGDNIPGPKDLKQGAQSFTEHLEHQFSTLGGTR